MGCSEFLDRFSDYFDGVGDAAFMEEAEGHVSRCASCSRYVGVMRQGRELVRSIPAVHVASDFHPRLRHRIYHLEDAEVLARGSVGSATTAATILGMAVLLTVVAWSPVVRQGRLEVELSPIVVSQPPSPRTLGLRPPPVTFSASLGSSRRFERPHRGSWNGNRSLLWESSPLFERYGAGGALRQAGLQ